MNVFSASIQGIAPILHHKFSDSTLDALSKRESVRKSGKPDYSAEWMQTMYSHQGYVYQPVSHIEGAMVKAATRFKTGRMTWKDPFRAYVYVMGDQNSPDKIFHYFNGHPIQEPTIELMSEPTEALSVSVMRVVVQRAAVARSRLQIEIGWQLNFTIEVHDDQIPGDLVHKVLVEAGRAVGIGDFRPRFGRFEVISFK